MVDDKFDWRLSVALVCLGKQGDRFSTYREGRTLDEKFELASQIEGLQGVGAYYPGELEDIDRYKELCRTHDLETSEIVVDIFSDPRFMNGSFANPSSEVRREAIDRVKGAMDAAAEISCDVVNPWPGQDGFDYAFQANYRDSWERMLAGVRECAEYRSDIRVALEYKPKEPRSHLFLDTVGKTLHVCNQVDLENLGVTLDIGHAMLARENISESAFLLADRGKLFNIHLNDNYGDWDWDLVPGTTHLWQFLEFLLWLKVVNYKGWMLMDVSPNRDDPVSIFTQSIRSVKLAWSSLLKVGLEAVMQRIEEGDIAETWKTLGKALT
jgi:xylose isomerase